MYFEINKNKNNSSPFFYHSILYLLSYLDRSNIANAKLGGIEHDAHLTPEQYRW
jgi:hypothetical protein